MDMLVHMIDFLMVAFKHVHRERVDVHDREQKRKRVYGDATGISKEVIAPPLRAIRASATLLTANM